MITTVDPRSATHFPLTRIVHLDDHLATRAGLRSLVAGEPDLLWVGAAADEAGMWTLIRRTHPSLVMLDVHHAGRGGLELCAELKAVVPTPAVVIYTSEEHEHLRIAARLVGADGVLTKDANRRTLLEAIRLAGRGRSGPVKIAPSLRARAASRLDPTDRAIFAMRLAGTAPAEIALTTELSAADVAGRIGSMATRLSSSVAEPPEVRNGQGERGGFALRSDVPRLRGSGRQRGPTPRAA